MMKSSSEVITCKAAVVRIAGEPPKVEEINVEPPKQSEVRIKMLCASICHTDISSCDGLPFPLFPRVPGHEGVGTIESVGEGVTAVKPGDLVMPLYIGECGQCSNCKSGKTNFCQAYPMSFTGLMPDGSSRLSAVATGEAIYQQFSCSTWSEYLVVDVNYVVKVDSRMSLPQASFLSCGFTTGFGVAVKEAQVCKGSTVAVFGVGAVGLGAIEGARTQGASKIIGVDINEMKKAKGEEFGMTDFINPKDHPEKSIADLLKEMTDGQGVDYCFECTGIVSLLDEAIDASKIGTGTIVMVGVVSVTSGLNKYYNMVFGRTLKGTLYGGVRPKSDLPAIMDKCISKEINMDGLLTHEVSLDEINKAFELIKQPDCVKILIKF